MISLVPLDVEKAYVITISHTGGVLSNSCAVMFFGPSREKTAGLNKEFTVFLPRMSNFLWWISRLYSNRYLDKFAILLMRTIIKFSLHAKKRSIQGFVVWARDLRLSVCTANLQLQTICEVHKQLTCRELSALKSVLELNNYLTLGPISPNLFQYLSPLVFELRNPPSIRILPMAATKDFFVAEGQNLSFVGLEKLRIGYFGSYETMQIESELHKFITLISKVSDYSFEVILVGIGRHGKLQIENLMSDLDAANVALNIVERVDHSKVADMMQTCHVLLLPYGENHFNSGRFPIKAVEYAASRVPILCSNTKSHRSILGPSRAFFYEQNDHSTVSGALQDIVKNPELRKTKIINAYSWALTMTYESRASKIIDALTRQK